MRELRLKSKFAYLAIISATNVWFYIEKQRY